MLTDGGNTGVPATPNFPPRRSRNRGPRAARKENLRGPAGRSDESRISFVFVVLCCIALDGQMDGWMVFYGILSVVAAGVL